MLRLMFRRVNPATACSHPSLSWRSALLLSSLLGACLGSGEGPEGRTGPPADLPPGLLADLLAGPVLVPDHVRLDSILELVVAVRNRGTRVAEAGWVVRVMLSADSVIDSADIQVDHFSAPRDLQPNSDDSYLRHKKLRGSTPPGLYYIGSILDVTERVPEASESNNILRFPATIVLTTREQPVPEGN